LDEQLDSYLRSRWSACMVNLPKPGDLISEVNLLGEKDIFAAHSIGLKIFGEKKLPSREYLFDFNTMPAEMFTEKWSTNREPIRTPTSGGGGDSTVLPPPSIFADVFDDSSYPSDDKISVTTPSLDDGKGAPAASSSSSSTTQSMPNRPPMRQKQLVIHTYASDLATLQVPQGAKVKIETKPNPVLTIRDSASRPTHVQPPRVDPALLVDVSKKAPPVVYPSAPAAAPAASAAPVVTYASVVASDPAPAAFTGPGPLRVDVIQAGVFGGVMGSTNFPADNSVKTLGQPTALTVKQKAMKLARAMQRWRERDTLRVLAKAAMYGMEMPREGSRGKRRRAALDYLRDNAIDDNDREDDDDGTYVTVSGLENDLTMKMLSDTVTNADLDRIIAKRDSLDAAIATGAPQSRRSTGIDWASYEDSDEDDDDDD